MIDNTNEYVALMRERAKGALPDMGCALRVTSLIKQILRDRFEGDGVRNVLDVGCAAGHFLRTFTRQNLRFSRYVGLEIDAAMVAAAQEIWAEEIRAGSASFVNRDLERFSPDGQFDFVICINAFMYFASAKRALANLLKATRRHLIVRSYFTDANYRIARAQTRLNHDKSAVDEIDAFDEDGNMRCFDYWNMYSKTYIAALVASIRPGATIQWLEDENVLSSLEEERRLKVSKRGATEVLGGLEVSYPFILPWQYLFVTVD
jgi:SAM-dependent methyltransferase